MEYPNSLDVLDFLQDRHDDKLIFQIRNADGEIYGEHYLNYFEAKRACFNEDSIVAFWEKDGEPIQPPMAIFEGYYDARHEEILCVDKKRYFYIGEAYFNGYEEVRWGTIIFYNNRSFIYDPFAHERVIMH